MITIRAKGACATSPPAFHGVAFAGEGHVTVGGEQAEGPFRALPIDMAEQLGAESDDEAPGGDAKRPGRGIMAQFVGDDQQVADQQEGSDGDRCSRNGGMWPPSEDRMTPGRVCERG